MSHVRVDITEVHYHKLSLSFLANYLLTGCQSQANVSIHIIACVFRAFKFIAFSVWFCRVLFLAQKKTESQKEKCFRLQINHHNIFMFFVLFFKTLIGCLAMISNLNNNTKIE